jgi:hypothetical protein
LSRQVLALDPNARGLRAAARYQRSKKLLQAALTRWNACPAATQSADAARKTLLSQPRRGALEDAAETNLDLAEGLWKQERLCHPASAPNAGDAVERVLSRLSRQ